MNKLEDLACSRKKAHAKLAVGISVVIDCESCMQWHIEQAATVSARFALDVMADVYGE